MNPELIKFIPTIKTDKFGNSLAKLQNVKTDFKRTEGQIKMEDLWVCLKSYKVGTLEQVSAFCNEAKQKKHGFICNPYSQNIVCIHKCFGGEIDIKELANSKLVNSKDKLKLEEVILHVDTSVVQWKEKVKKNTSIAFDQDVNPVKVREMERKQESYNNQKKMISLRPQSVFGIRNIGNTCFFNSAV